MVCALPLVSKPHLKRSDACQVVISSLSSAQLEALTDAVSFLLVFSSCQVELPVRHLVQDEGPWVQSLLLCRFRRGNLHAVRVPAAGVVREGWDSAAAQQLRQTS